MIHCLVWLGIPLREAKNKIHSRLVKNGRKTLETDSLLCSFGSHAIHFNFAKVLTDVQANLNTRCSQAPRHRSSAKVAHWQVCLGGTGNEGESTQEKTTRCPWGIHGSSGWLETRWVKGNRGTGNLTCSERRLTAILMPIWHDRP